MIGRDEVSTRQLLSAITDKVSTVGTMKCRFTPVQYFGDLRYTVRKRERLLIQYNPNNTPLWTFLDPISTRTYLSKSQVQCQDINRMNGTRI